MSQAMGVAAGLGLVVIAFYAFIMLLALLNMVFTITTLIRAAQSTAHDKLMWVLIIVLLPLFGWIIYRATREPSRASEVSSGNFRAPPPAGFRTTKSTNEHHTQAQEDIVRAANATRDALEQLVRKR